MIPVSAKLQLLLSLSSDVGSAQDPSMILDENHFFHEFHHRYDLLENDDLRVISGRQSNRAESFLNSEVVFCAENVPLATRDYFLSSIGFTSGQHYHVESAFEDRCGDVTIGMRVERGDYDYYEEEKRFVPVVVNPLVYTSSTFFTIVPPPL